MTSGSTGYDSKAWEQVKYFYDVNMSLPKNLVIVNDKAFAALDVPAARELERDITALLDELNIAGHGSLVVPGEYLEVVVTRH